MTFENDPVWIIKLAKAINSINSREGIDLLKNLYNEYHAKGMSPKEALEKAKKVVESFQF